MATGGKKYERMSLQAMLVTMPRWFPADAVNGALTAGCPAVPTPLT